jgi:hypothetical protein
MAKAESEARREIALEQALHFYVQYSDAWSANVRTILATASTFEAYLKAGIDAGIAETLNLTQGGP